MGRGFFGPSSSRSIKLAPMQATNKLELSPELRDRLGGVEGVAASSPSPPGASSGASGANGGGNAGGDMLLGVPLPSAPTTRWTPPTDISERLKDPPPAAPSKPVAAAAPSQPSGVETTIDDDDVPPIPPATPGVPRTEIGTAPPAPASAPALASPAAPPPQSTVRMQPAHFVPLPTPSAPLTSPTPPPPSSAPSRASTATTEPPATRGDRATTNNPIATTLDDEAPRSWARYTAMFVLLFLLGSLGAGAIAYHLGYFDRTTAAARPDDVAARAERALGEERWDAPPGDNVRDLTADGLSHWPNDARLLQVRLRAAKELEKKALLAKTQGDLHEATHYARLASELDPKNQPLRDMAIAYERELSQAPDAAALLFLADAGALTPATHPASQNGSARVTLDAAPAKPKLGQPVEFTARVLGSPKSVNDAHFAILGPGLGAGAKLAALNEGGTTPYTAGFTFLESGKFEVSFTAKADGNVVHATRTIVVDPPRAPSSPNGGADNGGGSGNGNGNGNNGGTPPAPTGSVKWL